MRAWAIQQPGPIDDRPLRWVVKLCVVDGGYAYRVPEGLDDVAAAPPLCAGIIGYRALLAADVRPGGRLGIYGFGGSAYLTAHVALAQGLRVHVLTRGEANRGLARALGVDSVGSADAAPPEPLDGAILFAPAGPLVPLALRALDRGGTLAVAGIWLSGIPTLTYERELGLRWTTHTYPLDAADQALADLAHGAYDGAAVLRA